MNKQIIVRETSPLASIQYLHSVRPIIGYDNIVVATVLGYQVVINKLTFFPDGVPIDKVLCVFFEPDALLDPTNDAFAFLDHYDDDDDNIEPSKKGKRVVSIRMIHSVTSQGLCMPLSILNDYGIDPTKVKEGQDVTEALKVTKFIHDDEKNQYFPEDSVKLPFPLHIIPKTNEPNLQSLCGRDENGKPSFLSQLKGRKVTVTLKMDGASMSVTHAGHLCGRNFQWTIRSKDNGSYFDVESKLNILQKLKNTKYSLQGELVGPGIQKNPGGYPEKTFLVFNMMEKKITKPFSEIIQFCKDNGLSTVPVLHLQVPVSSLPMETVDDWLDFADQQRNPLNQTQAEGVVVRTDDDLFPCISFKVLSREYLKKKK